MYIVIVLLVQIYSSYIYSKENYISGKLHSKLGICIYGYKSCYDITLLPLLSQINESPVTALYFLPIGVIFVMNDEYERTTKFLIITIKLKDNIG